MSTRQRIKRVFDEGKGVKRTGKANTGRVNEEPWKSQQAVNGIAEQRRQQEDIRYMQYRIKREAEIKADPKKLEAQKKKNKATKGIYMLERRRALRDKDGMDAGTLMDFTSKWYAQIDDEIKNANDRRRLRNSLKKWREGQK